MAGIEESLIHHFSLVAHETTVVFLPLLPFSPMRKTKEEEDAPDMLSRVCSFDLAVKLTHMHKLH